MVDSVLNVPQAESLEVSPDLCNMFLEFFNTKVSNIRAGIILPSSDPSTYVCCSAIFRDFEPVSLQFLNELVSQSKPSGSPLDSIPPKLFKEVFPSVAQTVLSIINSSLAAGVVPAVFKHATVQPVLKKPSLDSAVLANFRPISKMPYISKLLEKVVYLQLDDFLSQHQILEVFQSGFRPLHSTESALLRVSNDIPLANDDGDYVVLVLLDLTAAFDTVDHSILICRLQNSVGIQGTALDWFKSYLAERTMYVSLGGFESTSTQVSYGVPHGSVLGPLLFSLYLLPLGSILRKHGISFHLYADDSQIYLPLKKKKDLSMKQLLSCLQDVKDWLALSFLSFNENKTEVLFFGPSDFSEPSQVDLGPLTNFLKTNVSNLGFKLDSHFKLDQQINSGEVKLLSSSPTCQGKTFFNSCTF
uniref:Reverse transcriptase domain-containing protein n=1 Tax=Oryzias latipes TaxID=8090 RepID=A0A3B3I0M8_ORYLA